MSFFLKLQGVSWVCPRDTYEYVILSTTTTALGYCKIFVIVLILIRIRIQLLHIIHTEIY